MLHPEYSTSDSTNAKYFVTLSGLHMHSAEYSIKPQENYVVILKRYEDYVLKNDTTSDIS